MYVKVEVMAGAKEESVEKLDGDSFRVRVREKALRNMANSRVLELLRLEFGGRGVSVRIVSGHHTPRKIISIERQH